MLFTTLLKGFGLNCILNYAQWLSDKWPNAIAAVPPTQSPEAQAARC